MSDALVVVDVINTFKHDDGHALLESFRARLSTMTATLAEARNAGLPVIYTNDAAHGWDGDAPGLVRHAIEQGAGPDVVEALAPKAGDSFLFKPRYSGFDHTPLAPLLESAEVDRVFLVGAAVEGCVVQTAIDARELGFKATIVSPACATVDEELERIALTYADRVGGVRIIEHLGPALQATASEVEA
jgi:nicotinamidase-related amidase